MGRQEQLALRCHRYDQPGCRSGARPPRNAGHIGQLQSVGVRRRPVETLADTTRSTLLALRALQRPLFGLHAHYAEYNAGGINFNADFHRNRYQGHLYGAGLSYGYQWLIGKRWNLEATVGLGYARLWDRKYPIAECGEVIRTRSRNYFGPTKIGLALIFIIK